MSLNLSTDKKVICELCLDTVYIFHAYFCGCPKIVCRTCYYEIDYCDGCGMTFT